MAMLAGLLATVGCGDDDGGNDNTVDAAVDASDAMLPDSTAPDVYIPPPVCSDGLDNDGDGLVDYPADPGCDDAADMDESNPELCGVDGNGEPIEVQPMPSSGHVVANTSMGSSVYEGSCGGAGAPERIYLLEVGADTV